MEEGRAEPCGSHLMGPSSETPAEGRNLSSQCIVPSAGRERQTSPIAKRFPRFSIFSLAEQGGRTVQPRGKRQGELLFSLTC